MGVGAAQPRPPFYLNQQQLQTLQYLQNQPGWSVWEANDGTGTIKNVQIVCMVLAGLLIFLTVILSRPESAAAAGLATATASVSIGTAYVYMIFFYNILQCYF